MQKKEGESMNELLIAFILGIVEGAAEFLPISSTGHLILTAHLLDFTGERATTFEVVIQLGAMLAILVLYWRRFLSLLDFKAITEKKKQFNAIHLILGVLPAALAGLLLHGIIKGYLFSPWVVVVSLVLGAFLMIYADKKRGQVTAETLDDLTYAQSLKIGLFQCLAVVPGFSRSGSTISGGLLVGASYKAASEFSFLVALPIMVGATGLDLYKNWDILSATDIPMFAVGFVTAFVVALLAVKTFLKLLERIGLTAFAYYRILLAIFFTVFVLL